MQSTWTFPQPPHNKLAKKMISYKTSSKFGLLIQSEGLRSVSFKKKKKNWSSTWEEFGQEGWQSCFMIYLRQILYSHSFQAIRRGFQNLSMPILEVSLEERENVLGKLQTLLLGIKQKMMVHRMFPRVKVEKKVQTREGGCLDLSEKWTNVVWTKRAYQTRLITMNKCKLKNKS